MGDGRRERVNGGESSWFGLAGSVLAPSRESSPRGASSPASSNNTASHTRHLARYHVSTQHGPAADPVAYRRAGEIGAVYHPYTAG